MEVDLNRIGEQLESAETRAQELLRDLSDAQVNWQPDQGRGWSIGQCFDHLAISTDVYLAPMAAAAERGHREGRRRVGPIRPGWFARRFLADLEPPPKRKRPSFGKLQPGSSFPRDDVLESFVGSTIRARDCLERWEDLDLQGVRFRNPLVPLIRFTLGTGFLVIAAHNRRHLWQAERVRQAEGFPSS